MQAFDETIMSRIHLALKYEPLRQDTRKAVWEFFLGQVATTTGSLDKDVIDDIAEKQLNGREVRHSTNRWECILTASVDTKRSAHSSVDGPV
jgi:hypothetical protein